MSTSSIPFRTLGKNGPQVPAMGLGLVPMSGGYGAIPSDEERFKILDRAFELGITHWDSADIYGDNEVLIGKWFKRTGLRHKIFLSTKFGMVKGSGFKVFNSSAEYTREACEASLKAIETDYIDIYYLHRPNVDTPIEVTMRALAKLKEEGKIRNIGLSEVSSTTLRRACKIAPVAAVQMEYSPIVLDVEGPAGTNMLDTCRELGVSLVAYSPLGRGLLTETFSNNDVGGDKKDMRPAFFPRFQQENRDSNVKLVQDFKALADKKGCTTSQLSLAWLLKQGAEVIPIPGTRKMKYLEENWGALNMQLTDQEEAEIRQLVKGTGMIGHRLPAVHATDLVDTKEET
ncbi:aldo/keto reductase [Ilyonectria robusta]|uniref:aldo/keto reductase n=1 Tax=Ilyonectria robusta TaxID=1079257 RepID=UPI001E8ED5ED|nr:aldo/keto reductase [Ilyonectria robusta]KAH8721748.1 aldo/keto reductase [Ilyonectria robusta]